MLRTLSLTALLLGVGSCDRTRLNPNGCQRDEDCGDPASAWRCETQTGQCYCRTNDACPNGQFCNAAGFCQDRAGCEKNSDCLDSTLFCDTTSGSCIPKGRCSFDLQCPLGNVCDTSRSQCVEGCRSNGDCPGSSCRCGEVPCNCTGTTAAELQACPIGVCDPYFCSDNSFCKFGELCGQPPADAGSARNQCFSDFDPDRRPYCTSCSFGGGISVCGNGANYCLIDTQNGGNFCGTDCSEGQQCPRGYDCSDVIVVYTQWTCTRANPACRTNDTLICMKDADCKHGGTCVIPSGSSFGNCAGKCAVNEGSGAGFCTCLVDSDCAQESCSMGECSISRKKCVTQNDCRPIRCVDFDGVGGCLIGQNCAPGDGLSCVEVGN